MVDAQTKLDVKTKASHTSALPKVGETWWVLVPKYRHKGKMDVVWCGPYKVFGVLNKGENVKPDFPALFDEMRALNRDGTKPYIIPEGQPLWDFFEISRTYVRSKTGYSKIERLSWDTKPTCFSGNIILELAHLG